MAIVEKVFNSSATSIRNWWLCAPSVYQEIWIRSFWISVGFLWHSGNWRILRNLFLFYFIEHHMTRCVNAITNFILFSLSIESRSQAPYTRLPSARDRAHSMNRNMTRWLSGGAWSANANAVAVDFFTSTNLIDIAVSANQMKAININNLLVIDIFDPIKTESHKAEN